MQAFLPNDVSPVEHVFDLRQLVRVLDAAGHIKLPPDSRVLGAEVTPDGRLVVSIAHGDEYYGPNTTPLKLRHDFTEEIKLHSQIGEDALAAKRRMTETHNPRDNYYLKNFGIDLDRELLAMAEEVRRRAGEEAAEEAAEEAEPMAAEPTPAELARYIDDRVRDLYPKTRPGKTETFYAFVFKGDPFSGSGGKDLVVPFVPGESILDILNRFKRIAREADLSLGSYELFNGIIQKVHGEGSLATAEAAKSYRQDNPVPIPHCDQEAAGEAA